MTANAKSVMVVDDHPLMRQGLCAAINAEPDLTVVGECSDGMQAVAMHTDLQPDITVMDLRLPVLTGAEATARIRAHHPGARILILSSFDLEEDVRSALEAGAAGYVLKETRPADLIEAIRRVAHGQPVPSSLRATAPLRAPQSQLTIQELRLLHFIADGLSNRMMAERLAISENTVRFHMKNILKKLEVEDRAHAIAAAVRRGIIRL